jgi:hypothetical protein
MLMLKITPGLHLYEKHGFKSQGIDPLCQIVELRGMND